MTMSLAIHTPLIPASSCAASYADVRFLYGLSGIPPPYGEPQEHLRSCQKVVLEQEFLWS